MQVFIGFCFVAYIENVNVQIRTLVYISPQQLMISNCKTSDESFIDLAIKP